MENKFVPVDKMSKKARREYLAKQRVVSGFNTGTRVMKSAKDYNRQAFKKGVDE